MRGLIVGGVVALAVSVLLAVVTFAQGQDTSMPRIDNARVETRALAGPLAAEIQKWAANAAQPQWFGYAVPSAARDRNVCCGNYSDSGLGCGMCRLEGGEHGVNLESGGGSVKLEGSRQLIVLLRAEAKRVVKIRVASE